MIKARITTTTQSNWLVCGEEGHSVYQYCNSRVYQIRHEMPNSRWMQEASDICSAQDVTGMRGRTAGHTEAFIDSACTYRRI